MAKKSESGKIGKIKFGKRRTGVAKKRYGPKEQKPKPYRGQGR